MGEPRFSYGGICEVLGGRTYPLRAAIWPGETPLPQVCVCVNVCMCVLSCKHTNLEI